MDVDLAPARLALAPACVTLAPASVAIARCCLDRRFPLVRASAPARIRMALRKTALIRVPQLRRRPGRLCQSTCHGFPPAIRTRTVAWRGVTVHNSRHRTRQRRPAPRVPTCAPACLAPRTRECRRSHQHASPSHQRMSPARTLERRPSHQQASRIAPTSVALAYGAPENRLDPRPSAPPPARAAMPKHLPRFSSGPTDSHCRMARRHGA